MNDPALSATGLANFITGDSLSQRNVLRSFKYPDPEGEARATYYHPADSSIRLALRSSSPEVRLRVHAIELERDVLPLEKARVRMEHNLRVIREFADIVSQRRLVPIKGRHLAFVHAGVTIRATPDLFVMEEGTLKLIKLHHREKAATGKYPNIVRRVIWLAATRSGMDIKPDQVVLLHTASGKELGTSARNQRVTDLILAACDNIAVMWPTIPKRLPGAARRRASAS